MSLTLLFGFLTIVCAVDMKAGYSLAIVTLEEELIGKRFKLSSSSLNRRKTEYTKYNVCLQPGEQMGRSIWELDPLLASSLRCVCLSLLVDLLHRNPQPFHWCDLLFWGHCTILGSRLGSACLSYWVPWVCSSCWILLRTLGIFLNNCINSFTLPASFSRLPCKHFSEVCHLILTTCTRRSAKMQLTTCFPVKIWLFSRYVKEVVYSLCSDMWV